MDGITLPASSGAYKGRNFPLDRAASICQHCATMNETKNHISLTRATLSTCGWHKNQIPMNVQHQFSQKIKFISAVQLAALVSLLSLTLASAQTYTIVLARPNPQRPDITWPTNYPASTNIVVGTDEVIEVLFCFGGALSGYSSPCYADSLLYVSHPGSAALYFNLGVPPQHSVTFAGLVTIGVYTTTYGVCNSEVKFLTYRITKKTDSFIPSNAVLIPADARGPVTVLLESSTNLVDWAAALPGTYGSSSMQRFFRVRALEN
jgi:hypothetical protein